MNSRRIVKMCGIALLFIAAIMLLMPGQAGATNSKYNRVARLGAPQIDGNLNDPVWQKADWQEMDVYAGGTQPAGFKAKSAVLWDDKFFYAAIEVDDQVHAVPKAVVPDAGNLWQGDSPQHRVDLEYDSISNSSDDIEWGYALQDGKILTTAWSNPSKIEFKDVKIIRDDAKKKTYYETAVVIHMVKSNQTLSEYVTANQNAKIGYSDMVNANDGGARLGWLEWSSGIGASKDANLFGTLTFDRTPLTAVNFAGKLVSTWGDIKR
jgi:hypothetical protein